MTIADRYTHPDSLTRDITRDARPAIATAISRGFADNYEALETAQVNARGFLLGMIPAETLRDDLVKASAALERMNEALRGL